MSEAEWFRSELEEIFGRGAQSALASFMELAGDTRDRRTILRSISNAATGRNRVSGEMRVILAMLRHPKAAENWRRKASGG